MNASAYTLKENLFCATTVAESMARAHYLARPEMCRLHWHESE